MSFPDGRFGSTISRYRNGDKRKGMYHVTPFFEEQVCYLFSLPQYHPPVPADEAFGFDLMDAILGASESVLKNASAGPMSTVDGQACRIYEAYQQKGTVENISYSLCVGPHGELFAANSTTQFMGIFQNHSA